MLSIPVNLWGPKELSTLSTSSLDIEPNGCQQKDWWQ